MAVWDGGTRVRESSAVSWSLQSFVTNSYVPIYMEVAVVAMPIEEVRIEVPWGHIAGKVSGSPSGPPVLCVHGIQDNANTFDHLIPLLPSHFCFVAIDLPGHGRSSHFPTGTVFSQIEYCMSLCRVVHYFGWKDFIYIGHSLGGQLGYLYASLFPHQVSKFVMLDAVVTFRISNHLGDLIIHAYEHLFKLEKSMASKSPPSYTEEEAVRRLTEGRPTPLTIEAAQVLFSRGAIRSGNGYAFSADQRLKLKVPSLFSKEEAMDLGKRIQCPVFIVRASQSRPSTMIYDAQTFDDMLKNKLGDNYHCKFVEGSHDVHLLQPEKFAVDLSSFLLKTRSSL